MVNNELLNHIENEQNKGVSPEDIQIHLKQWNYSQNEIDESFKYIKFKEEHHLDQVKPNHISKNSKQTNLMVSVLGIFVIAVLLSMGTFFFLGSDESVERYAPEENISEPLEPELFQLAKTDSTVYLNKDESKRFFIENEEHKITLDGVGENYADLTLSSDPIKITIFVAQEISVDIDGDKINDISLKLVFTDKGRVSFKIRELEQPVEPIIPKKENCKTDSECDDDLINTIDSCEWVEEVKECVNIIRDACETDTDCDYMENQTGKCVKTSLIPYCEFDAPDECVKDTECDDKDETTEDTCLALTSRPNRCLHSKIDTSDCGEADKIKYIDGGTDTSYSSSKALICLGNGITSGIDVELKYEKEDSDEEMFLEIFVDDDEYDLKLEFEDFEDELEFLDGKELECNFDEDEILEIACNDKNCTKSKDYEIGNYLFTYLLKNLVKTPYELREYCKGDLMDELDPLPTGKLKGEDCEYDEDCFDDELKSCSFSYFSTHSSDEKIFYQVKDLKGSVCEINISFLKSEDKEGLSALCDVPTSITGKSDFGSVDKWIGDNLMTGCTGSYRDYVTLITNSKKCIANGTEGKCIVLYTKNQIISINGDYETPYRDWFVSKGVKFLDTAYDKKDYSGYCDSNLKCIER